MAFFLFSLFISSVDCLIWLLEWVVQDWWDVVCSAIMDQIIMLAPLFHAFTKEDCNLLPLSNTVPLSNIAAVYFAFFGTSKNFSIDFKAYLKCQLQWFQIVKRLEELHWRQWPICILVKMACQKMRAFRSSSASEAKSSIRYYELWYYHQLQVRSLRLTYFILLVLKFRLSRNFFPPFVIGGERNRLM